MRFVIQREEAFTYCEEPHPMRLGRSPVHYPGEPWERRTAIDTGKRGYRCPGGAEHTYPIWVVFDADDERIANVGAFDIYADAVACRERAEQSQVV